MVVATTAEGHIVIGISEADLKDLKKGLTKIKQGGEGFGFRSLMVFLGKDNESMIKLLQQKDTKRSDDMFPEAGYG